MLDWMINRQRRHNLPSDANACSEISIDDQLILTHNDIQISYI